VFKKKGDEMITYTVSTNEYTYARALMGIANILERMEKEVMPLDDEQVNALHFVVDAVRYALPTHWCGSKALLDLYSGLRDLAEEVSMAAVATVLKEQEATSDKKGLSDDE